LATKIRSMTSEHSLH